MENLVTIDDAIAYLKMMKEHATLISECAITTPGRKEYDRVDFSITLTGVNIKEYAKAHHSFKIDETKPFDKYNKEDMEKAYEAGKDEHLKIPVEIAESESEEIKRFNADDARKIASKLGDKELFSILSAIKSLAVRGNSVYNSYGPLDTTTIEELKNRGFEVQEYIF